MSKTQTEKMRFPSKYSNSFVSVAQYITELLCEKIAKQKGSKLPFKFWDLADWNKIYRRHIVEAHKLAKKYDPEVLIKTLGDKRLWNMNSFLFPPFAKILLEYKKKISQEKSFTPPKSTIPAKVKSDGSLREVDRLNKLRSILNQ